MRIAEGDQSGGKSNKLAALTGMGDPRAAGGTVLYPGRDNDGTSGQSSPTHNGYPVRAPPMKKETRGPNDDDPLDRVGSSVRSGSHHGHSSQSHSRNNGASTYIVTPSIQARAEFPTIARHAPGAMSPHGQTDAGSLHSHATTAKDGTVQPLTCIVVVELPSRRSTPHQLPGQTPPSNDPYASHRPPAYVANPHMINSENSTVNGGSTPTPSHGHGNGHGNHTLHHKPSNTNTALTSTTTNMTSTDRPMSPTGSSYSSIGSLDSNENSPFRAITEDLRARIIDWKGHSLSGLGPLQLYDHLHVRREALLREFYVYLFREAIICVIEEKKRTFRGLGFGSGSGSGPHGSSNGGANGVDGPSSPPSKGVLRLKGRIFVRHVRNVTDTSVLGELSLTIDMEDDRLDSFILIFKERGSLETWRQKIMSLVQKERTR